MLSLSCIISNCTWHRRRDWLCSISFNILCRQLNLDFSFFLFFFSFLLMQRKQAVDHCCHLLHLILQSSTSLPSLIKLSAVLTWKFWTSLQTLSCCKQRVRAYKSFTFAPKMENWDELTLLLWWRWSEKNAQIAAVSGLICSVMYSSVNIINLRNHVRIYEAINK